MFTFIINPVAGNGRAKKLFSEIQKSKLYHEIECIHHYSKYIGHAEEIAKQISTANYHTNCIIVVGGDGTLHEVMNGIGNKRIPVSFIPGGSGNDFARGCMIEGSATEIFKDIINNQQVFPYWLGNFISDDDEARLFVSNMGFGFDAEVTAVANKSKYKNLLNALRIGEFSYVIALLQVLLRFKPQQVEVEIDGEKRVIQDCWMVTIANHPYYGGGMEIIPGAMIQPVKVSILLLHSIPKWKVLGLFMTVFTGKHIYFKEVELIEASTLKINVKEKINYQVDGQTSFCTSCAISKHAEAIGIMGTKDKKDVGA